MARLHMTLAVDGALSSNTHIHARAHTQRHTHTRTYTHTHTHTPSHTHTHTHRHTHTQATDRKACGVSKFNRRLKRLGCLHMSKCHIVGAQLYFCPENVVCFLRLLHISSAFQTRFFMEANTMTDLGPYILS